MGYIKRNFALMTDLNRENNWFGIELVVCLAGAEDFRCSKVNLVKISIPDLYLPIGIIICIFNLEVNSLYF